MLSSRLGRLQLCIVLVGLEISSYQHRGKHLLSSASGSDPLVLYPNCIRYRRGETFRGTQDAIYP